jgi:hypothetical protein
MAAPSPYNHATRSEVIDLAAAEGHDADIPTNAGSIRSVASHAPTQPQATTTEKDTPTTTEKDTPATMEKDIEKGADDGSMTSTDEPEEPAPDSNVVDFDGPDDMENPLNWKFWKKWGMVMLISAITFLTPLASSMFAPGVPEVMQEFNSTNDMLEGFMVSVYVLGVRLATN